MAAHAAAAPVAIVSRLAASGPLQRAVGVERAEQLGCLAEQVSARLAPPPPGPAAWQQHAQYLEALHGLARECLALAASVDRGFDDGTALGLAGGGVDVGLYDPEGLGPCGGSGVEDSEDCAWDFGVAVAEAAASGLAALAAGLGAAVAAGAPGDLALEHLERMSLDLDYFAAHLFGGLSRLESEEQQVGFRNGHARLQLALQSMCIWALAAVGRVVGCASLSASVLWEWACRDAVWALVLAKGVLSCCPGSRGSLAMAAAPEELAELQRAVLFAVLGLPAADVAFATVAGTGGDIGIASRNEDLAYHRAELASAVLRCKVLQAVVNAAISAGPAAAPPLAGFLVALLQPELAMDCEVSSPAAAEAAAEVLIGACSPEVLRVLAEARRAAAALAAHLARFNGLLWSFFAGSAAACPSSFLQACATLAHSVPPARDTLQALVAAALPPGAAAGGAADAAADAAALAGLCLLSANGRADPGDGGPLVRALLEAPDDVKQAVADRWARWRGPVRAECTAQWALLLEVYEPTPAAQVLQPLPASVAGAPEPPAAPAAPQTLPAVAMPPSRGRSSVLRELVAEAPAEFRCAFDGQLMMDPVRSPQGVIFERVALAHALHALGGLCPATGAPLALEDCERVPELRRRIAAWVRGRRGASER